MNNFVLILDETKQKYFKCISSIPRKEIEITDDFNKAKIFDDEDCLYYLEVKNLLEKIGIRYIKIKTGE